MDPTYVYAMDEFKGVFASAALTAQLLIFIVEFLKARFPSVLYGERTTALTLVGGPLLMLTALALEWIPAGALTWQGAIAVGVQVSVMAMGGHAWLKTMASARTAGKAKATKKAEAAATAAERERARARKELQDLLVGTGTAATSTGTVVRDGV